MSCRDKALGQSHTMLNPDKWQKMMDEWVDSVYTECDDCRLLVVGVELLQVGSGQLGEKYEVR